MASSPVGQAFVLIRPDLSQFASQLRAELAQQIGKVREPTVTVRAKVVADSASSSKTVVQAAADEVKAVQATGSAAVVAAQQKVQGSQAATAAVTAETAAQQKLAAMTVAGAEAGLRATKLGQINAVNAAIAAQKRAKFVAAGELAGAELTAKADKAAAAAKAAGALAAKQAAEAGRELTTVEKARTSVLSARAAVETAGLAATSKVGVAQAKVAAIGVELRAAQRLSNLEAAKGVPIQLRLGAAYELQAIAALNAAKANLAEAKGVQVASARSAQAARGIGATALGFAGLRGAVLASSAAFLGGVVALTAFAKSVSAGASLEQGLNLFQATTEATAKQMREVSAAAIELGKDVALPGVSAGDAALTMTELAKAGLSVQDSIEGARGVLLLATAANIEFADASTLAASALNTFGLEGDQAARVADVFAGAANAAQGSIQDFGLANQQVGAVARQVGLSLEDTTALLAELAKNGLRGSDAGTSLRTALIRLVAPTTEARNLLDQLGVSIRDAQGNIDPLVFARFGEATANLAPDLRDMITATIFGQDAIRAVAIAAREGEAGFNRMKDAVSETGTAQELADARAKGLTGAVGGLTSNFETFGATLSETVIPVLTDIVQKFSEIVAGGNTVVDFLNKIGGELGGFGEVIDLGDPGDIDIPDLQKFRDQVADLRGDSDFFVKSLDMVLEKLREIQGAEMGPQLSELGTGSQSPLAGIDDAINKTRKVIEISRQLSSAIATFSETGFDDPAIRDSILSLIAQLESIGGRHTQSVIKANMQGIAQVLGSELQALAGDFGVTLENLNQEVPQELKAIVAELGKSAAGREVLRKYGQQLSDSLAEGIEDNSNKPVEAAQKTVDRATEAVGEAVERAAEANREAIKRAGEANRDAQAELTRVSDQATQDLVDSVVSGREKLTSLGDTMADAVGKLIEVGPLAQKAKQLQDELDGIDKRLDQFKRSRQSDDLESTLTSAQADLDRQRSSITSFGKGLTDAQKSNLDRLLGPAQEKVKEATADIKEFRLEGERDAVSGRLAVVSEKVETNAERAGKAIQTLVDQLQLGKINAGQFAARLQNKLAPELKTLSGKAGKNLGLRFTSEFQNTMATIVAQAQALAAFVNIAAPSSVVKPADVKKLGEAAVGKATTNVGDTRAAGAKSVADTAEAGAKAAADARERRAEAEANLASAIAEGRKNQKKTADNSEKTVGLLTLIEAALTKPKPKKPVTDRNGAKPNAPSVPGTKVQAR